MTFTESGLPAGTQWGIDFGVAVLYSTTNTILLYYPNGTYGFAVTYVAGYAANPSNGTLTISGSAVTQAITFSQAPLYNVSFVESGLTSGTKWTVSLYSIYGSFGTANSSTTNTVTFVLINGSYSYYASPVTGYNVTPTYGYIFVNGSNVTQKIIYYPSSVTLYTVYLEETGYPGSVWNVSLNGVNQSTLGQQYGFVWYLMPNGTYHFSVGAYTGYTAYPASGTIQVNGANVTQPIYYYPNSVQVSNVTFTGSNMHSGFGLLVEVYNSTNFSINGTIIYSNLSSSSSVSAYIPVGNYVSVVGEFSNPNVVYGPNAYNISESVFFSYLNITSSSPVTLNTVFPTLWKVTLQEVNLHNVDLWGVLAESANLVPLLGNQIITPSPNYYSIFQGYANLSLSQTTLTAYLPNADYEYSAVVTAYNQTGNFTVSGANTTVYIYFPKAFYTVTFIQTGLPLGYYWQVTINGTTEFGYSNAINFTLPNGTYSFTVGQEFGYVVSPASGTVTVSGSNTSQTIVFAYTQLYDVTFIMNGLPAGTQWSVTLNNSSMGSTLYSSSISIVFYMPTGNYTFSVATASGYILSPSNGTVLVPNSPVYVPIQSLGYGYSVKFTETGLPSGTTWFVNLSNGKTLKSTASSISTELANGSYNYTVASMNSKYTANSGTFAVSGSSQSVAVNFANTAPVDYNVTFSESGLPNGTSWSITLNGTTHTSTSANITFSEANGTYAYTVGNVSGYNESPASGNLTVSGSALTKAITFSKQSSTPKSSTGLSMTDYEIIGGVVVVAVIAGVAGLMVSRRKKKL